MTAWGTELFDDDLANQIERSFLAELLSGKSIDQIITIVNREFSNQLKDSKIEPMVVLTIASQILDCSIRDHPYLDQAKNILSKEDDLEVLTSADEEKRKIRKLLLQQLRDSLMAIPANFNTPEEKRKRKHNLKIGDVLQIPLADGRFGYGQYVYFDPGNGALLQIFDIIVDQPLAIDNLTNANPRFGPMITYISQMIRSGRWQYIGNMPVRSFEYHGFINGSADEKGKVNCWWYWDGEKEIRLGSHLPEKYKKLELRVIWAFDNIEERILTGTLPYIEHLRSNI